MITPIYIPHHPSWCETHDCQCPCHEVEPPWHMKVAAVALLLLMILGALWLIITIADWASGNGTLADKLASQGAWLVDLVHRIY